MSVSTSYERLERLGITSGSVLFRARRSSDGAPALLKSVDPNSAEQVLRLKHELETLRSLDVCGVPKAVDAEPALVALEPFDGITLESWRETKAPDWQACVRAMLLLTQILEGLHRARWVHGDIRPENVLINARGDQLCLADFSRAIYQGGDGLPRVEDEGRAASIDWAYVSPEQTGRVNRSLDHRSDFYSLGIMLYRLLSGSFPFAAADPLAWVHAHVARLPRPLLDANPSLPRALADIVHKLLAKDPDDRYQSGYGLRRDLARCLERGDGATPFELGTRDIGEPFTLRRKLYGRENERAFLVQAFATMAETGRPALLLLHGHSGVGKSALAHEFGALVESRGGRFLSGKFDPLERDVPYATIGGAIRDLIQRALSGSAEQLADLRSRLAAALGPSAAVISEVIPQVELVLGAQPPLPELPPLAARSRFESVFANFVRAAARPHEPLVIFLDDVQWADEASLALIERVLSSAEARHSLLLCAFRSSENATQLAALGKARNTPGVDFSELELGPLAPQALEQLLDGALGSDPQALAPLLSLVQRKTGANPFFVRQFLVALYRRGLLSFDDVGGAWQWDIESVQRAQLTDNVADLVATQLDELPAETQTTLAFAACLGQDFDLRTLAALTERAPSRVAAELRQALDRDLIVIDGEGSSQSYRWAHDRVQQVAYSRIAASEVPRLQLCIGRYLARELSAETTGEALFRVAAHLNAGAALIESADEKRRVAELDLRALGKAKATSAYAAGLRYASSGLALLGADAWRTSASLTFALHFGAAECEYLSGNVEGALSRGRKLLEHARERPVKAATLRLMHDALFAAGQFKRAVELELACLRLFDVVLPAEPTWDEVRAGRERVNQRLGERPIEAVVELPPMSDPELEAVDMAAASFFVDPKLYALQSARMVELALEHGNSDAAPLWYGSYGAALSCYFDDYEAGYRFARAARELWLEHPTVAREAKLHFLLGWTAYWKEPLAEALEHYRAGLSAAQVSADVIVGCYCASRLAFGAIIQGGALEQAHDEIEQQLSFVRRAGVKDIAELVLVYRQYVRALRGRTRSLSSFDDGEFDEQALEARFDDPRMSSVASRYWILKLRALYESGEFAAARSAAQKAEPLLGTAAGQPALRDYVLYRALALSADFEQAPADEQQARLRIIGECAARLGRWAEANPSTFRHGQALVRAELARISGQSDEAARAYEEGLEWAERGGFVAEEALAHELCARFYRGRGFPSIEDLYVRKAYARYADWGATRKLELLRRDRPRLVPAAPSSLPELGGDSLDFLAVLQASQAISSEIVLDRLLETLMRTLLASAGADRGALLLVRDGNLLLAARGEVVGEELRIESPSPQPPDPKLWPLPILNYVQRTRERVILGDARQRNPFAIDRAAARSGPKSLSCLPIVQKAALRGLLYLENNLVSDAFTPQRTAALELLAAQAAVSLENARLFAERESAEKRFSRAFHDSPTPMAITRIDDSVFVDINESNLRMLGYAREEVIGKSSLEIGFIDVAQREAVRTAMRERRSLRDKELQLKTKSGQMRTVMASLEIIELDGVSCFLTTSNDVTERRLVEAQLRQAQKMEAIGQLAGGIAHDFNNLLTVINGYGMLAAEDLDTSDDLYGLLCEILKAGERAAGLTQQLLAYSRKQMLEDKWWDLNLIVADIEPMLKRLIGEDVRVLTRLSPTIGLCKVDRGQLEQIILNLAVNARDAMPQGGRLTLETSSVLLDENYAATHLEAGSGPHVLLSVSDTGVGMTPEVASRIFEPFFTTKETGKGTGLGLAVVYGIVKQSGGSISVRSEPNLGTSFMIYLPEVARHADKVDSMPPTQRSISYSGNETVLLVEDEGQVRRFAARALEALGYVVFEASNGVEALELVKGSAMPIHLLITDVIMPDMGGPALVKHLTVLDPATQVLYISGYAEHAVNREALVKSAGFLQKPFSPFDLAKRVREILDNAPGRAKR